MAEPTLTNKGKGLDLNTREGQVATLGAISSRLREIQGDTPTISADSLKQPTTPIKIPNPKPNTGVDSMLDDMEAGTEIADKFTANLEKNAAASALNKRESFEDLINALSSTKGESSLRFDAEEEAGVPGLQEELDGVNQEIRTEQHSLRRQLERIEDNSAGLMSDAAVSSALGEAKSKSFRKQADLYVIQQGLQGRFDSAKSWADRAVQASLEQTKMKNETLQFIYNEYEKDFSEDERRLFETKQADRERMFDREEKELQNVSDLSIKALEKGAPASVVARMRGAKTVAEALSIGGAYFAPQPDGISWSERKQIIELAKEGDPAAIQALGYDPRNSPASVEQYELQKADNQLYIDTARELIANPRGLGTSSGFVQSPFISGLFSGGKASGVGTLTRFTPVIGNIQGAVQSVNDKQNFLSAASYLINNDTFAELLTMKEGGATFGSLTEGERVAVGRAANRLAAAAKTDSSGNITGFNASEEQLTKYITEVLRGYEAKQRDLDIKYMLDSSDMKEISETPSR